MLTESGRTKTDIAAVFVDIGPGGYAGLRVGVSIAKALAHGLGVPIVGIGRLELDAGARRAMPPAPAASSRCIAPGGGDVAWAAYANERGALRELSAPRFDKPEALASTLQPGNIITGDVDDELTALVEAAGAEVVRPAQHRVVALAAIGRQRLDAGRRG